LRPDLGVLRGLAGAVHAPRLPAHRLLKRDRDAQLPLGVTRPVS
jgi:hypothetical protein